jgi:hypothetical protein
MRGVYNLRTTVRYGGKYGGNSSETASDDRTGSFTHDPAAKHPRHLAVSVRPPAKFGCTSARPDASYPTLARTMPTIPH